MIRRRSMRRLAYLIDERYNNLPIAVTHGHAYLPLVEYAPAEVEIAVGDDRPVAQNRRSDRRVGDNPLIGLSKWIPLRIRGSGYAHGGKDAIPSLRSSIVDHAGVAGCRCQTDLSRRRPADRHVRHQQSWTGNPVSRDVRLAIACASYTDDGAALRNFSAASSHVPPLEAHRRHGPAILSLWQPATATPPAKSTHGHPARSAPALSPTRPSSPG